jgi:hypothetical protein
MALLRHHARRAPPGRDPVDREDLPVVHLDGLKPFGLPLGN